MYKIIGGDQKEYGPVSFDQLASWVRDNRANAQTLVQKEGGAWAPMGTLPEFASLFGGTSAPRPAPTSSGIPEGIPSPAGTYTPGPTPAPGYTPPTPAGTFGNQARDAVQGPATGLMITGILGAIAVLIGAAFSLFGMANMPTPQGDMPPEMQRLMDMLQQLQSPAMIAVDSIIKLAVAGLIIVASVKLRKLESFPLVVTSAILAIVPCTSPCCCVGIPIGIWVLVAIMKPEVKSSFR